MSFSRVNFKTLPFYFKNVYKLFSISLRFAVENFATVFTLSGPDHIFRAVSSLLFFQNWFTNSNVGKIQGPFFKGLTQNINYLKNTILR